MVIMVSGRATCSVVHSMHRQSLAAGHRQSQATGHRQSQAAGHRQSQATGHRQSQATGHRQSRPLASFLFLPVWKAGQRAANKAIGISSELCRSYAIGAVLLSSAGAWRG